LLFYAGEARIFPEPEGRDAEDGVEAGAEGERVEGVDEGIINFLDEYPEVVFGDEGV